MEDIRRITEMEQIMDRGSAALAQLTTAWESYLTVEGSLQRLSEYYASPQWRLDIDLDRSGGFPPDLKRGVLSEDGIWDLLTDWERLRKEIKEHLT